MCWLNQLTLCCFINTCDAFDDRFSSNWHSYIPLGCLLFLFLGEKKKEEKKRKQEWEAEKEAKRKKKEEEVKLIEAQEEEIKRKYGRSWTVSIALPASILDNAQSLELRTYLAGQVARAAVIFQVDEIVLYDEFSCPDPLDERRRCLNHFAKLLQYLECPQYLRKDFFPIQRDLQYAGLLNPLDCLHHLKSDDLNFCYREGIVMNKKTRENINSPLGSYVNVGLPSPAQVDRIIQPGVRVTVSFNPNDLTSERLKNRRKFHAKVVSPSEPRLKYGYYWGYTVRIADSLSTIFTDCPFVVAKDDKSEETDDEEEKKDGQEVKEEEEDEGESNITTGNYGLGDGDDEECNNQRKKQSSKKEKKRKKKQKQKKKNRMNQSPGDTGYDLLIGTSENGDYIDQVYDRIPHKFRHALIVFGGLKGIEAAIDADAKLSTIDDAKSLFHYYINTCPGQGSNTIRTEEAILISLSTLRGKLMKEPSTTSPPMPWQHLGEKESSTSSISPSASSPLQ